MATTSTNGTDGTDRKYPSWNGDWSSFVDYTFRVELHADGLRDDDLAVLGPRLASNLTGRAFDSITDINRDKLKKKDGWKYLIQYLEKTRGKQKVDLLGDSFSEFFMSKTMYRKENEELVDYEPRFRSMIRRLEKALRDSGAEGKVPSEIFGWYLLNCFMKMEPSDVANVRGRAASYKLDDVMSSLQIMWSGGGLAAKDAEVKKRRGGHALLIEDDDSTNAGEVYQ